MIDFTVLIPVFNTKAPELIEAVYSVHKTRQSINQDYDIVIVDDGSISLETINAINFLEAVLKVHVIRLPKNMGTSAALNAGHDFIKTEYIAINGSSDISHPDRFKIQCGHLEKHKYIDVLGTNLFSFSDKDLTRKPLFTSKHSYTTSLKERTEGWLTNHGTVIYKNQSVKDVGGYKLPGRYQDVDLWKRMSLAGKSIHTLPDIMYAWRKTIV